MPIEEYVNIDEVVVGVFTTRPVNRPDNDHKIKLQIDDDCTGSTGNWRMNPYPGLNHVLIYYRDHGVNHIFKAKITRIRGPLERYLPQNRYRIYFENLVEFHNTDLNWTEFTGNVGNPVRYVNL